MKVFLDTNVLVSAFATRGLCADVLQVSLREHELVLGETVLAELRRVLTVKVALPSATVDESDAFLRGQAVVIRGAPALSLPIRDRSDVPVLAEAVAGGADVLVTGDRDLLGIAAHAPVAILSPRGFWQRLRETPEGNA